MASYPFPLPCIQCIPWFPFFKFLFSELISLPSHLPSKSSWLLFIESVTYSDRSNAISPFLSRGPQSHEFPHRSICHIETPNRRNVNHTGYFGSSTRPLPIYIECLLAEIEKLFLGDEMAITTRNGVCDFAQLLGFHAERDKQRSRQRARQKSQNSSRIGIPFFV